MTSFCPTYRAPLIHLMDDASTEWKTLCGVAIVEGEWNTAWDPVPDDMIEDKIGCGCRKCQSIAATRLAASQDQEG